MSTLPRPESLRPAGLALLTAALLATTAYSEEAAPEYLPLGPEELADEVGRTLLLTAEFFHEFGGAMTVTDEGKLASTAVASGDRYREARDAASVLQRAQAFRLLSYGSIYLPALLDLAHGDDVQKRRGAVWLLTRPPEPEAVPPVMILELLEPHRLDSDTLVRATMARLPHRGDVVGARDPHPWVRASWHVGHRAVPYQPSPGGEPLSEFEWQLLLRGTFDSSAWVRAAAAKTGARLAETLSTERRVAIERRIDQLAADQSPWPRPSFPEWQGAERSVGWVYSLSGWVPLPWLVGLHPIRYRDGAVGNPAHLVKRLEYLRSAANVAHLPVVMLLEEPEPELRATAAVMRYAPGRVDEAAIERRLRLIEDPSPMVRLAAVLTFDEDGEPYPPRLVPELQRYVVGGLQSASRWENHAAIVLARGLRRHWTVTPAGLAEARSWLDGQVVPVLGELSAEGQRAAVHVMRTLLGELPESFGEALAAAGIDQSQALAPSRPSTPEGWLQLARGADGEVRAEAVTYLLGQDESVRSGLLRAALSGDPRDAWLRADVVSELGALDAAGRQAVLAPLLADETPEELRAAAGAVLDELGGE